ncbi:BZ3500_MvSof-1268-A1-R1_Chr10-1g02739 [Microbotryum saponariae]|uniref:BZ3500_MvSof-1268-A1-R1_Chr10-1g02739 protein n=1 Tax=Microbotryum saponariae TaxID=289078 RepID=A0A2X0L4F2_9BASI|nr:BZ3500_MvSof-1268-A1-R1_Chr10-1g02739 [Microbotryum saponariae]SDA06228.1 BZ3501_MvSof-1269-A2-R1_Chr10-1g02340 [Microbotryum saponariae]
MGSRTTIVTRLSIIPEGSGSSTLRRSSTSIVTRALDPESQRSQSESVNGSLTHRLQEADHPRVHSRLAATLRQTASTNVQTRTSIAVSPPRKSPPRIKPPFEEDLSQPVVATPTERVEPRGPTMTIEPISSPRSEPRAGPSDEHERRLASLVLKGKKMYKEATLEDISTTEGVSQARRQFLESYEAFKQASEDKKASKAAWKVANLTADLGYRASKLGDNHSAARLLLEARSIFQRIGDLAKEATCLQQLGLVCIASGDPLQAADYLKNAIVILIETGNVPQEASTSCELANLLSSSDPPSAILFYKQVLVLFCKLSDSVREARTLYAVAKLYTTEREYATSFAYYLQARVIFRRLGETWIKFVAADADCSYALGKLAAKGELFPAAVSYLEEASLLYRQVSQPVDEAWSLYRLSLVMLRCGDHQLAIDYLLEAQQLFAAKPNQLKAQASCCGRIAQAYRMLKDPAKEYEYTLQASRLHPLQRSTSTKASSNPSGPRAKTHHRNLSTMLPPLEEENQQVEEITEFQNVSFP